MRLTDPIVLGADYSDEDVFDIAKVTESTITSSDFRNLLYGKIPPDELIRWLVEDVKYNFQQEFTLPSISASDDLGHDVEKHEHLIVRDLDLPPHLHQLGSGQPHSGRIVAHAEFRYLPKDWIKHFAASKSRQTSVQSLPPPMPEATNKSLITHFRTAALPFAVQLYGGKQRLLLKEVATLSSHTRNGAAGKLISWAFPYSDRDSIPVVLAATSMGFGLYRKLGFEEVRGHLGILRIDRGLWGGEGVNEHVFMIRLPNEPEDRDQVISETFPSINENESV